MQTQTKTISITTWCQERDGAMKRETQLNVNEMNTMLDVHEIRIEERSNIRISNRNSSNSSNKWIKVSDAVTLWTRSNERQWRGEQERKNKHFQQSALRNRKREGKGGDHTLEFNRNTAHSTIISIYVFAFSARSSTHVMLETKHSVSQPVCIRMKCFLWFEILQKFNRYACDGTHTHNNKTQSMFKCVYVWFNIQLMHHQWIEYYIKRFERKSEWVLFSLQLELDFICYCCWSRIKHPQMKMKTKTKRAEGMKTKESRSYMSAKKCKVSFTKTMRKKWECEWKKTDYTKQRRVNARLVWVERDFPNR